MKILNVKTLEVEDFVDSDLPPFAVFSYTCSGDDRPTSIQSSLVCGSQRKDAVSAEIQHACSMAERQGIHYLWIYSVCINESSPIDNSEAFNALFGWLQKSAACFVYLHDLPGDGPQFDETIWRKCKYWTCAWTIQELIAPPRIEFFDQNWNQRGTKASMELLQLLSNISGIPKTVLLDYNQLWETAIAMRISWAAGRQAKREEDVAYWLASICGVGVSPRYGEGASRAFARLQKDILQESTDGSIFAWRSSDRETVRGLLARSPSEFRHFLTQNPGAHQAPWILDGIIRPSNKGLEVQSRLFRKGPFILMEIGRRGNDINNCKRIGVWLRKWNGIYVRVDPTSVVQVPGPGSLQSLILARDVDEKASAIIKDEFGMQTDFALEHQPNSPANITGNSANCESRSDPLHPSHSTSIRAGTKRDRLGNPKIPTSKNGSPLTKPLADSELYRQSSPSTVSGEDTPISENQDEGKSDSGWYNSDAEHLDDSPTEKRDGDTHELFQRIRPDLVKSCFNKFQAWLLAKHPHSPRTEEQTHRKRVKISKDVHRPQFLKEEAEDELGFVPFHHHKAPGNFICPFYARDPFAYHQCLVHCDLRSVDDVIHHIGLDHNQPAYCPICYYTFETVSERDNHIYERLCEARFPFKVDGISYEQKMELMKQDDPNQSNEKRWLQLFELLFPESKPCRSSTVAYDFEQAICLMREFWSGHGHDCISKFLRRRQLLDIGGHKGEKLLVALRILVLGDLTEKIIQNYSTIIH